MSVPQRTLTLCAALAVALVAALAAVRSYRRASIPAPVPAPAQSPADTRPQSLLQCEGHDDLGEHAATDPRLLLYDERESLDPGIESPRALAVGPDDRVYVAGEGALAVLDRDGRRVSETPLAGSPHCLAVHEGTVFLGMRDHVEVLDGAGARAAVWETLGERAYVTSVAATDDDVFVADAGNLIVLRFDRSGRLRGRIGARDPAKGIPGFIIPSACFDVAVGTDGSLWAADTGRHSLENYRPNGDLLSSWGEASADIEGFCGCCNPAHFAVLPDGRFVTSEKGFVRVKVYDQAGKFAGVVAGPEAFQPGTAGLDTATDSQGRILVLDPKAGRVRVFVEKSRAAAGDKT